MLSLLISMILIVYMLWFVNCRPYVPIGVGLKLNLIPGTYSVSNKYHTYIVLADRMHTCQVSAIQYTALQNNAYFVKMYS